MNHHDPRMNPRSANIFGHDTSTGYTGRVVRTLAVFFGAIFLVGVFVSWYFFHPPMLEDTVENDIAARQVEQSTLTQERISPVDAALAEQGQSYGNHYQEGTGRSGLYNFFYTMFGGIDDGLDDNPHNLRNVARLDDNNLNSAKRWNEVDANRAINDYAENKAAQINAQNQDDYQYSVYDMIGGDISGVDGQKTGRLHDIIVNKDTGEARALIIDDDESYRQNDLKAININKVYTQDSEGNTRLSISENNVENREDFKYTQDSLPKNMISLRRLRAGQILDFNGEVAGEVDAIIYQNGEAQNLYFKLKPKLVPAGKPAMFELPFDKIEVIENADGLDIRMNKEQTEALAKYLYAP